MKILVLAVSSAALIANAAAIDFSPQYSESVQDGFPVRRLYFSDDKQHIYLTVPKSWQISGNGQRGIFTPPEMPQALVTWENSPLKAQIPFDEKGLEVYRKAAFAVVPTGAVAVKADFEKLNELHLNGWTSFEMEFSYEYFGQSFLKSVIFLNLDQEKQLRLQVVARKENFEKFYPQARGTLSSWFSPSPELEAALAKLAAANG